MEEIVRTGNCESMARIERPAEIKAHSAGAAPNLPHHWAAPTLRVKFIEEQLSALRSSLICAFNQLLDLKDLNTGVHSTRLAEWALHVAGEFGLDCDSLGDIEVAALLHDIGKIGVSDAILNKPAKLSVEEYELMKKHPEYGWAVLAPSPRYGARQFDDFASPRKLRRDSLSGRTQG